MTLVDTNVIIDVFSKDPTWFRWSADKLEQCAARGPLYINEVTYAELSSRIATETELQFNLNRMQFSLERAPTAALFAAGRALSRYRAAGGPRTTALPDFFIGAHASVREIPLLTRDVRRYRTYFPDLELIAPPS